MAHGDARKGKWRGNWRMQWVASTLHTTSEHGVSIITTTDAHTSAASTAADLNGLVRFAERRNLVSAHVPSHFTRSLLCFPCGPSEWNNTRSTEPVWLLNKGSHGFDGWEGLQDAWATILISKISVSENRHHWSHHSEMKPFLGMLLVLANLFYYLSGD